MEIIPSEAPVTGNVIDFGRFRRIIRRPQPVELSLIIPVFNNADQVEDIVLILCKRLSHICWEAVFVDDVSTDQTASVIRRLARTDTRVRLIERFERRGLYSAMIEGILAANADVIAVVEGKHGVYDLSILPELFDEVSSGRADFAVASRVLGAGGSAAAAEISGLRLRLANRAFGLDLSDPLTGVFAVRRSLVVEALPALSGQGFSILLDLITALEIPPIVKEIGVRYRPGAPERTLESDSRVLYDLALFFIERKLRGRVPLPARFLSFCIVNGIGICVHLMAFAALVGLGTGFATGQLFGTFCGMAFNFTVNNALTYSERKLTGRRFYTGFLIFCMFCSVGVIANVGMASVLHEHYDELPYLLPALAGAVVAVVWNYGATQAFVWGRRVRHVRRKSRRWTAPEDALAQDMMLAE
jgi:dolichol-phosphate mannosyltransferase